MTTQVVPFLFETSSPIRTFTDDQGNPWFCAKDVCDVLGYANSSKAITDHCRPKGITNRDTPMGCDVANRDGTSECEVTDRYPSSKARKSQEMTYINEGNLYRLIVKSRKPEAEKFEAWIYDEVIPSIRKHGGYAVTSASVASLASHTVRSVQIGNSKAVNQVQVALGGANAAIAYNLKNCTIQSGRTPAEWKTIAKAQGLPSKQRGSAKDILRAKVPQVACGMSLSDQLVAGGATTDDGISIGKDSQPIFQRILALGITPPELLI